MSDFSKIAEELALTAKSARQLRELVEPVEKQANSITDSLSGMAGQASDYLAKNPQLAEGLKYTLGGAAVGGLLGGASGLFAPKEKRNVGRSALHGALAGAGIGGGGYLLNKSLSSAARRTIGPDARKQQMLDVIKTYENRPGFLGKLKETATNPIVWGVGATDASLYGLGAWASRGPEGRANTQTQYLSALRQKLLENPKLLNADEAVTKHFLKSLSDPNSHNVYGVRPGSSAETKLRQIFSKGRVRLPDIPILDKDGTPKPGAGIEVQITRDMLTPVTQQLPRNYHWAGPGSVAHILKQKLPHKQRARQLARYLQDISDYAGGRRADLLKTNMKKVPRPLKWWASIEHKPHLMSTRNGLLAKKLLQYGVGGLAYSGLAHTAGESMDKSRITWLVNKYLQEGGDPSVIPDAMKQQLGV